MNIDPDVRLSYVDFLTLQMLERVESKIVQLQEKQNIMAIEFDNLVREVSEMSNAVDSAIVLIQSLRVELIAVQEQMVDPALLQPLVDSLDAKQNELATAVANVPVE